LFGAKNEKANLTVTGSTTSVARKEAQKSVIGFSTPPQKKMTVRQAKLMVL